MAGKRGRPPGVVETKNRPTASKTDMADVMAEHSDPAVRKAEALMLRGLTDQEKTIAQLRMRGFSQSQIARFLGVTQPYICMKLRKIREHQMQKGTVVDQDLIIGQTTSLYEEIEHRAWEIHTKGDNADKLKALQLVLQAREKQTKLLMDLGKLDRQGTTNKIEVDLSPIIQKWSAKEAKQVTNNIIEAQLSPLPDPEPPMLEAEIIQDAVLVFDEDEETASVSLDEDWDD